PPPPPSSWPEPPEPRVVPEPDPLSLSPLLCPLSLPLPLPLRCLPLEDDDPLSPSECPRRRCRCERPLWSAVDEDDELPVPAGVEVAAPVASGAATAGVTWAILDARADRDAVVVGVLARAAAAGLS